MYRIIAPACGIGLGLLVLAAVERNLALLAVAAIRSIDFGYLRINLDLAAGNLSQHLTVLENAGLVSIEKGYEGKRARTWVSLTPVGQAALHNEIAQLTRLINHVDRKTKRRKH